MGDMSLVDGFTLPFQLQLRGCSIPGGGSRIDCSGLTLANCPHANKVQWNGMACPHANKVQWNGRLIGCRAGGHGHGSTEYVNVAHRLCPHTYAFDLDDRTGNHNCPAGTEYIITFMSM